MHLCTSAGRGLGVALGWRARVYHRRVQRHGPPACARDHRAESEAKAAGGGRPPPYVRFGAQMAEDPRLSTNLTSATLAAQDRRLRAAGVSPAWLSGEGTLVELVGHGVVRPATGNLQLPGV